ncbi:hypothetical protein ANN_08747 [Periplaneta americana]|uniref:Uncharacterized protein n=1 Tax=Periplaneta americana TaxID=6978 RepID=A0ABQ8T3G4_PERAM|nr:hypothetical protein ANN_08747 [Periplaneta americana]
MCVGWPGERFSVGAVQEIDRFGGGFIMVWFRIMYNNHTDLVIVPQQLNAVQYIKDVLEEYLVSAAIGVGPDFCLFRIMSGHILKLSPGIS